MNIDLTSFLNQNKIFERDGSQKSLQDITNKGNFNVPCKEFKNEYERRSSAGTKFF